MLHSIYVSVVKYIEKKTMMYYRDNLFLENSEKSTTPITSPDNSIEVNLRRKVEVEFALKYSKFALH